MAFLNRLWPFDGRARPRHGARIPVLTYHAANAHGFDYATNDHRALEHDIGVMRALGFRIADVRQLVDYITGEGGSALASGRWVALTFDDGPDVDYFDFLHPDVGGCLKSFYRILSEASDPSDRDWPAPTAVSFVIADENARAALDRTCLAGRGHWRDTWWHEAAATGVLGIANHSWDHAHPALARIRQREQRKGTFLGVDNEADADAQIAAAQRLIWFRTAGLALPYFAYPYGEAPAYVVEEYFPRHPERHGIAAAFGTGADYAAPGVSRWNIPRFVFGQHWRSPEELEKILLGATRGSR